MSIVECSRPIGLIIAILADHVVQEAIVPVFEVSPKELLGERLVQLTSFQKDSVLLQESDYKRNTVPFFDAHVFLDLQQW